MGNYSTPAVTASEDESATEGPAEESETAIATATIDPIERSLFIFHPTANVDVFEYGRWSERHVNGSGPLRPDWGMNLAGGLIRQFPPALLIRALGGGQVPLTRP